MRSILSALLLLHGLVHLVGFIGPLEIVSQAPFETVVFRRKVPNASVAGRSMAALWLLLALACAAASIVVLARATWWFPFTSLVLLASLFLCITTWPATKAGAPVNVGLLLTCLLMQRAQLWVDLVALLRVLPF